MVVEETVEAVVVEEAVMVADTQELFWSKLPQQKQLQ